MGIKTGEKCLVGLPQLIPSYSYIVNVISSTDF
jgi:hypothetical protein